MLKNKVKKSNEWFNKTQKIIPLSSQTFSKSYLQYIKGTAPLFIKKAKGCHIYDIDGNKYIDLVSGLAAISLGYQNTKVDAAIKKQLKNGISFSLSSTLEYELASLLKKHIPSAEMVRFGKNGSDVTTASIRLARAITKKDHIAVGGYHGWHDWYIGSTPKNIGIPESTKKLTHKFDFNNIESLKKIFKKYPKKIAAVILEPTTYEKPKNNFLSKVKKITHNNKAILIFDEVASGFKTHIGGAQTLYKVTPDLTTIGKSMGNGMPISALVGKKKYMSFMENIFFSSTAGGETLSLAAAIATIKEMEKNNFSNIIEKKAVYLKNNLDKIIKENNLSHIIYIIGTTPWQAVAIKPTKKYTALDIKSFIQQELIRNNILWVGSHILNASHKKSDLDKVINAYKKIIPELASHIEKNNLKNNLEGGAITDVFKTRK